LGSEVRNRAQDLEWFEQEVRPLLSQHCYSCHSVKAEKLQANLLVDSRDGLLHGGDSGAALVPGDADGSLLIEAVKYESYEMPPSGKLSPEDIKTLERWVEIGAPWPEEQPPEADVNRPTFDLQARRSEHWVWQPMRSPEIPPINAKAWPRNSIDHFILARLEQKQLAPAPDAEQTALLRRVYFDLIGLPPTAEQITRFLQDSNPQKLETLIDELLDSPHFGERWGRHWLDLVRYAESRGHEFDNDIPNAYQYRDYVIRAFNADVPYDQLVREHIAGDLITEPRLHPRDKFNESVLGTGFWFLGEWVHSPVDIRKDESDRFDNMIDVMSKTFLGVTVACARCHDHKFDAISTEDYYSLSGFLQSSDYRQVRFDSLENNRRVANQLADLDERYQQAIQNELDAAGIEPPSTEPLDDELASHVVVDYGSIGSSEYMQDGFVFGRAPRRAGAAYMGLEAGKPTLRFARNAAAFSDYFWNGLTSVSERGVHNQSRIAGLPRSGRTLRSPTFLLVDGKVACRVQGEGHVIACVDSHRMIAGPLHGETIKAIRPRDQWVQLNLDRYVGHRVHLEFTPANGSQLEVSVVTQGASAKIRQQLENRESKTAKAVSAFADPLEKTLQEHPTSAQNLLELAESWAVERSKLQEQVVKRSRLAMAMLDGTGEDDHVLIRGDSSKSGQVAPRRFLTAIAGGEPMQIRQGSGRMELARQINDPTNPLTARVIVNRIWHHLMGRGIVPTADDFGVLGKRPTHPELLDFLALKFREDRQSIKQFIRYIMLSRTYQMSSFSSAIAVEADPKNLLWHHRPPKRLQGEVIRDSLLAISGQLKKDQLGEPVPIHLTSFMQGRGRPAKSGPLDGDRRRSIYIAVRRNFLSPFMLTFDTPAPFSTMGKRTNSNVPAQALILMNDPLVKKQARLWAEQAIEKNQSIASRVEWMYQTAFARPPSDREKQIAERFVEAMAKDRNVRQHDLDVWANLAHVLFNTKEFIFLR